MWGQNDPERIQQSVAILNHRGPDNANHYHDSETGLSLGHTRLAIQDLSPSGAQPMFGSTERYVLVYNGEIYNFQDLRRELEADGQQFRGHSDSEVLLYLYERNGPEILSKLNGIFAFAIWDDETKELFLARDSMGVKPIYYCATDFSFSFSSEIKALPLSKQGSEQVNIAALNRYLSYAWCPGSETAFKNVQKLNPGYAMILHNKKILKHWRWAAPPAFSGRPSYTFSKADAIQETRRILRQAVERQMVSDAPLGAFLSGGLDSSSIVAFAREFKSNIECFTIKTPDHQEAGRVDDFPYAERAARHLRVKLHAVEVSPDRLIQNLEFMIHHMDEPIADAAALNVFFISRLAREHGMKVLLSGAGGDDLFTGYPRHTAFRIEKLWSWMPKPLRRGLHNIAKHLPSNNSTMRRLGKLLLPAHLPHDVRLLHYFQYLDEEIFMPLYTPDAKQALKHRPAYAPMLDYLRELPDSTPDLEKFLALEQRFFLSDHNLIYTDKMSMAAGVEVRVPFLDPDLLDFAYKIPAHYKMSGKELKWILKKAMEPDLPHDIIYRPKTGFGAPIRQWMRHDLREMAGDIIASQSFADRGIFDVEKVQSLLRRNDQGRVDAAMPLFAIIVFELWCRIFMDQSTVTTSIM